MFRIDLYTKIVLTAIAVLLGIAVLRPVVRPAGVLAQGNRPTLFVEPGVTVIRRPDGTEQQEGKVVMNLQTGEIWGFKTLTGLPYPVDPTQTKPPVSDPIYLGKFNFAKMNP
jgi:hypothetical protein